MSDEVIEDDRPIVTRKAVREYNSPHDAAIRAANWAMKDDPQCVTAHLARHEVPKARAVFEAANANWRRVTTEVFDRVMAAAGFPQ